MSLHVDFLYMVFEHPELSDPARAKNKSNNFPEYRPRKAHSKSRHGCVSCKARRIKVGATIVVKASERKLMTINSVTRLVQNALIVFEDAEIVSYL